MLCPLLQVLSQIVGMGGVGYFYREDAETGVNKFLDLSKVSEALPLWVGEAHYKGEAFDWYTEDTLSIEEVEEI